MLADRRVSPDAAFLTALKGTVAKGALGKGAVTKGTVTKGTIGKGAAEQALRGLELPRAEQVGVVQRFLDGKDAKALSPAARAVLVAFIEAQQQQGGGTSIVKARQSARHDPTTAARDRVLTLLQHGSSTEQARERHARVSAWLDAAEADFAQAGARLAGLADVTGGTPMTKATAQGHEQLALLLGGARKREVTKGDVEAVRRWLAMPPVPPARVTALRRAFERLDQAGTLSWTPGGVAEHHRGVRFAKVELARERHADGFTYTAWIPVGALAPGARLKDPSRVDEIYVERSGGLAGLTLSVGPISVGGDDR